MMLSLFALSATLLAQIPQATAYVDPQPVTLSRVFTKGEKLQYSVVSNLHVEDRPYGLATFMPQDIDLSYKFTTEVRELKPEGIAVLHYLRPTMTQVDGETAERLAKTTVEKIDMNFDLTVSPINKILDQKDLNPPKKKKKPGSDDGGDGLLMHIRAHGADQGSLSALMGQFINEMRWLAVNIGSLDSALDFAPKLPLDEVKEGDTWKETVGYQPQKLKGKEGKQAVQRLDYTFTYKGIVIVNGKKYYRINAALALNTDLADFINQLAEAKPDQTGLKSIPMTLKQSVDYDLDMATKRTVAARAKAEGGFKINVTQVSDEPVLEENLTGTTEMRLISVGTATPAKTTLAATKPTGKHGGKRSQ